MKINYFIKMKTFLAESGLIPTFQARKQLSYKYIRGAGLEIGALNHPLPVLPEVQVSYFDCVTRAYNIKNLPEIDPSKIVETHIVGDGFSLAEISSESVNFIIGNHILEHAENPVQVLINWERCLAVGGIIFITVPIGERCFDKGRPVTTVEHFIADYQAAKNGATVKLNQMNYEHYRQWLTISQPRINKQMNASASKLSDSELDKQIEHYLKSKMVIHFHVFSPASFCEFLECVTKDYLPNMTIMEIKCSQLGAEYIAVLRKMSRSNGN